jgi:hypothetical protein
LLAIKENLVIVGLFAKLHNLTIPRLPMEAGGLLL